MGPASLRQIFSGMLGDANGHVGFFARSAARGHSDLALLWDELTADLDKLSGKRPWFIHIFLGILDEARSRDSNLAQQILDKASKHPDLRKMFATLQQRVELDARGIARLEDCLNDQTINPSNFASIAWQEPYTNLPEETLVPLLRRIASKRGGVQSVTRGLAARFRSHPKLPVGSTVAGFGLTVATQTLEECLGERGLMPHVTGALCSVIDTCSGQQVPQADLDPVLRGLVMKLPMLIRGIKAEEVLGVVSRLAKKAPHATLDILFTGPENTDVTDRFLTAWHERESSAFSLVDMKELVSWAGRGDRESRLRLIARVLWPVSADKDSEELHLTEAARETVRIAEDPVQISLAFAQSLSVVPRRGDRDTAISRRLAALHRLSGHSGLPDYRWAKAAALRLEELAEEYHQKERRRQLEPFE